MKTMNLTIALPKGESMEHVLGRTACIIGSDHMATLRLQGDDIAHRHAVIESREDGWHILALTDDFPVTVNGIPTDSARLRPGDEVCIGAFRLSLHETPVAQKSVSLSMDGPAGRLRALQKARIQRRRFRLNLQPAPEADIQEKQRRLEIRLIGWNTTLLSQKQVPANTRITIGEAADDTFIFPRDMLPGPSFTLVEQYDGQRVINVPADAACSLIDARGNVNAVTELAVPVPLPPSTAARVDIGDFRFHLRDIAAERVRSAPLTRRFPYDSAAVWIIAYALWGLLVYQVQLLPEAEVADIIDAAPNRTVVMNLDPEEDQDQPDPEPEQRPVVQVASQPTQKVIGKEGKYGKETSVVDMGSVPIEDFVNDTGILGAATEFMKQLEQQPTIDQQLEQALASLEGPSGVDPHGIGGMGQRDIGHGGGGVNLFIGGIPLGSRRHGAIRTAMNYKPKTGPRGGMKKINPRQISMISGADPSLIAKVMNKHLNQFRYCYQTQLRIFPNLYGKIAVQFVIEGNGRVSSSRAMSNTMRNVAVEDCVIRTVKRLMFPPIKGGGIARVTYPFLFTSQ